MTRTPLTSSPPSPHQATLWKNCTVGLLGGSFNPAHEGHRHISLHALKSLGLDAVWWMVSPQNPLKSKNDMASLEDRVAGAVEASRHHPRIIVTDIERLLHTHYTADTLSALKKHFPRTRFVWLMGTDNLRQIHLWHEWERIFNFVPVAVLDRPPRGSNVKSCPALERFRASLRPQEQAPLLKTCRPPAWTILHIPLNRQSATALRKERKLRK
ncbi:MAG: nicotinate-nucleotide adenylyltransferase [Pseudomonadota bacterium]